jgi:hypothetical protein
LSFLIFYQRRYNQIEKNGAFSVVVANLQLPVGDWRVGMKKRTVIPNLQPPVEDWRVGMQGRKVVANLQLPRGDWRVGMEGKESDCSFTTSR